jgi:protein SCO1/2
MRFDHGSRFPRVPGSPRTGVTSVARVLLPLSLALVLVQCGASAARAESMSVFQPRWHWQDEHGKDVSFSRWRGAPLVVTVIYTSCKLRCPMTTDKLRKLDAAFTKKGERAHFILVTLDPGNDTPERLLDYKASRRLPAETWHLLRGSEAQTKELCRFLDVRVLDDRSHIDHDVKIRIFDSAGTLAGSYDGWRFDDDKAVNSSHSLPSVE